MRYICILISLEVSLQVRAQFSTQKAVIEHVGESLQQADGREYAGSKGKEKCNKLTEVNHPVRAGKTAFRHWVSQCGERSELAMTKTEIGKTYWYGWSMYLPEDFDYQDHATIVMQMASWSSPRDGEFPCSGNGHKISISTSGEIIYDL